MKTLAMLLLAASSLVVAQPAPDVKWEHSLPVAQALAAKEGKPIFLDVYTDWCGWCTRLRESTFPSPEAKAALAAVVPLSLRTQDLKGNSTDEFEVQARYGVKVYPTLLMLDAGGNLKARHEGYLPPAPFAAWVAQNAR